MKISVIIPTIGRPTLRIALESVRRQLLDGDEILVVGDGSQPEAKVMAEAVGAMYLETEATRLWGHAQRNAGMKAARGEYLAFLDDDDIYFPGALEAMRLSVRSDSGRPALFRMRYRWSLIWKTKEVSPGNVSTQMLFLPNRPDRLAVWKPNPERADGRGGDFHFIRDTGLLWPEGYLFREGIVAELGEHGYGQML